MKKIIIPRRDHEVYFLPAPKASKAKQARSFVADRMDALHPGFSSGTALDTKKLVLDKRRWIMATVMDAEALAEYRVLHKGAAFFTNTSIAVHKKDFTQGGMQTIEDELIGYDPDRGSPVSIPLGTGVKGRIEGRQNTAKNVPAGYAVFAARKPALRVTAMMACASLLAMVPLLLFQSASRDAAKTLHGEATNPPPASSKLAEAPEPAAKSLPAALETLAQVSADFARAGGIMARWQYDEAQYTEGKLATVEARGIGIPSLRRLFSRYEHIVLEDIPSVRYIEGEPCITAFLCASVKGYAIPETGTFFSQNFCLPIFSDLAASLGQEGISIVSETLPSIENGNALYTVSYTAKDQGLIRSLEAITEICGKYPVRVKALDVSISGESDSFAVACSLAQSSEPRRYAGGREEGKGESIWGSIPQAFGYRESPPPRAAETPHKEPQTQKAQEPPPPAVSIVGTIRDDSGQILFYREAGDGKIIIKDTH